MKRTANPIDKARIIVDALAVILAGPCRLTVSDLQDEFAIELDFASLPPVIEDVILEWLHDGLNLDREEIQKLLYESKIGC
ncbi:MAG: hypothetical protein D6751_05460 [Deltaproteobacteria bacterium]|nr:MAG: hypothetical protein D6751_05460 [Deltaproteobacteria bacterium]